jgi:hypothetical protein
MSLLIAVKSCQRDMPLHNTIRQTWGRYVPRWASLRFFVGGFSGHVDPDVIELGCADDYRSLPYKTKEIANWFLRFGNYSHIFLCDNDTFLDERFFELYFHNYDYAGRFNYWPTGAKIGTTFRYEDGQGNTIDPCHAWASGGFGYFLSRKAAAFVATMNPVSWAEDLSVGQVLGPKIQSGEIVGHEFNYDCVRHKGGR